MNRAFVRLVALVARRDYLRTVRRRGFVAGTLLLPISVAIVFGVSAFASTAIGSPGGALVVVNESAVALTPDPTLTPHVQLTERTDADARLSAGTLTEYYVVAAEWPARPRVLVVTPERPTADQPELAMARRTAQQSEIDALLRLSLIRSAGLPEQVVAQLFAPVTYEEQSATGDPTSDAAIVSAYLVPYAFTLVFMLSIFITSGYLLQSVTEEKENRVVEILLSSVPALPLMTGKVIGLGAAGLTQVAIWVVAAIIALPVLNQQFSLTISLSPVTMMLAIVFFGLGYLSYGAIYAAVGALAPGAREAQQYASFFGFVAVIPIVLLPLFLGNPNGPAPIVLSLLPLTAPASILAVLALSEATPWLLVGASLISQVAFMAVAIVAAGRIFRATVLLYGVRPSLRRIVDAMVARG
jgi:ABC-2 type transport system permease protein